MTVASKRIKEGCLGQWYLVGVPKCRWNDKTTHCSSISALPLLTASMSYGMAVRSLSNKMSLSAEKSQVGFGGN